MTDLRTQYNKKARTALKKQFEYGNDNAIPRLTKVVVNAGLGRMMAQSGAEDKVLPEITENIARITGQKPALTRARKSIAGFKLRQGTVVGARVTLRGQRMYDFLDRLIHVVLPRLRDFRGLSYKNFDKSGNLTIGIREYSVFPEVPSEQVRAISGLQITVVTDASSREEAIALFEELGFPLEKKKEENTNS